MITYQSCQEPKHNKHKLKITRPCYVWQLFDLFTQYFKDFGQGLHKPMALDYDREIVTSLTTKICRQADVQFKIILRLHNRFMDRSQIDVNLNCS